MQNRFIEQSLSAANRAVIKLQNLGFTVERLELGGGGKPRIKIGWSPKCGVLGEPSVFSKGNAGIRYETYLVQYEGCQVSWVKR